jgi:LCP family protein required for cell wall assembly
MTDDTGADQGENQDEDQPGPDDAEQRQRRFELPKAVLRNPATLPEPHEPVAIADAVLESAKTNDRWIERGTMSEEERAVRRARRDAKRKLVRRRRRTKKIAVVSMAVVLALMIMSIAWAEYLFGSVGRMPAVADQTGVSAPGHTFLLVGANPEQTGPGRSAIGGYRGAFADSDLIMVLHVDAAGQRMYVISIPHDSAVPIPGHGTGKLSVAYADGGAPLFVRTVEQMTGVRFDRVITLDLGAFASWADLFGGLEVDTPVPVCGEPAGPTRLDGRDALAFITLRACLPGKDLDRVTREQGLIKALMRAGADGGLITNPFKLNKAVRIGSRNATVEDGFSTLDIIGTLWSMRNLAASNTTFLTVPVAAQPLTRVGGIDYVRLDAVRDAALWQALRTDTISQYLALN